MNVSFLSEGDDEVQGLTVWFGIDEDVEVGLMSTLRFPEIVLKIVAWTALLLPPAWFSLPEVGCVTAGLKMEVTGESIPVFGFCLLSDP